MFTALKSSPKAEKGVKRTKSVKSADLELVIAPKVLITGRLKGPVIASSSIYDTSTKPVHNKAMSGSLFASFGTTQAVVQ